MVENYGEAIELSEANNWGTHSKNCLSLVMASLMSTQLKNWIFQKDIRNEVATEGATSVITNRILSGVKQDLVSKKELEGRFSRGRITFNLLDEMEKLSKGPRMLLMEPLHLKMLNLKSRNIQIQFGRG